ncbi:hypothetical protein GDO81_003520 [Engystomops pustulosus]|nr:hypothetical protein GDO81_003520 [Engystomops pustulosus]
MVAIVWLVGIDVTFIVGHWSLRLFIKTRVCWLQQLKTTNHRYIMTPSRSDQATITHLLCQTDVKCK